MSNLKYFLLDVVKHKERVHQLYFIGVLLQPKFKNRLFVKLDSRYAAYFPEYSNYFGRALMIMKSVYGMTNSGKLFAYDLIEWLLDSGFIQYQCHISIYYNYASDGTKIVVLSYVYDCVYWYTYESIGKWFWVAIGKRLHVNFLVYAHWFMSIRISYMKDHSISVDQYRYNTSIVTKYLYTDIVNASKNFYKTNFPSDMIFAKADASTSDEKVEKLAR